MSDVYNHYFCALDVISNLPHSIKNSIDKDAFFLGAQGSDIFFYYNLFFWRKTIPYGGIIHKNKINDFFYNFIEYINKQRDVKMIETLYSYLLGYICHHALDQITHPFIIYHSGIYDKEDDSTIHYKYLHKKYEILLDVALLQYKYNITAKYYNIQKIFNLSDQSHKSIEGCYAYILKATYELNLPHNIVKKSIKSEGLVLSFLKSNSFFIEKFIALFEKTFALEGYISTAMYPKTTNNSKILNLDNQQWSHPCDLKSTYTHSYPELFDMAVELAVHNIMSVAKLKNSIYTLDDINNIFGNISYETGLPCTDTRAPKFFDKKYVNELIKI